MNNNRHADGSNNAAPSLLDPRLNVHLSNPTLEAVEKSLTEWAGGARPPREVVEQAMEELALAIDAMDAELETSNVHDNDDDDENDDEHDADDGNAQGGDDANNNMPSNNINPNEDMDDEHNNNNPMEDDHQDVDDDDDEDAQIIIIGGWLGSGPLAASDMWVLDISGGMDRLRWFQPVSVHV